MSKLKAMQSMPPAKAAQMFKSLEKDLFLFGALVLAKGPPLREGQPKDLRNSSRFVAKLVSQDLKGFAKTVARAAETEDKQFFIDLGKCLSGELKREIWDRMDIAIASIVLANPSITAKDGVLELARFGFPIPDNDAESFFRMRKKRLRITSLLRACGASSTDGACSRTA